MVPFAGRFILERAVEEEDWESRDYILCETAKKVGIKKIGERTSLLWKLREGDRYFDDNAKCQVENEIQERKGLV